MAYSSLSDVKGALGVSGTTHDAVLSQALDFAQDAADEMTGRVYGDSGLGTGFDTHSVEEVHYLTSFKDQIQLREWPIQSITSVTDDGSSLTTNEFETRDRFPGTLFFIDSGDSLPQSLSGRIVVDYIAGFPTTPKPVQEFVIRTVDYLFNKRLLEGISADLVGDSQQTMVQSHISDIFNETISQYRLTVMY